MATRPMGPPPPLMPKPGSVKVARVNENYKATRKEELSVDEGDQVFIRFNLTDKAPEGFVTAKCGKHTGWIPKACVEVEEIRDPIHDACRRGNLAFLQEYLKNGLSTTTLDAVGNTALYWAASCGHKDCVKLLLSQPNPPLNVQNHLGNTPLHGAAACNNKKIVKRLLKKGADCTIQNEEGKTAEEIASDLAVKNYLQKVKPSRKSKDVVATLVASDYAYTENHLESKEENDEEEDYSYEYAGNEKECGNAWKNVEYDCGDCSEGTGEKVVSYDGTPFVPGVDSSGAVGDSKGCAN